MSFKSRSSKTQAQSTVNKLLASVLPGVSNSKDNSAHKPTNNTQLLSHQISKKSVDISKQKKLDKIRKNKKINNNLQAEKKFNKLVKYSIIKKHKENEKLSEEEAKYLKKLVKKNSNLINNLKEIDDESIKQDIEDLKHEILAHDESIKLKNQRLSAKQNDFEQNLKSGKINYPGLTPGLAPVDYNESDEDE